MQEFKSPSSRLARLFHKGRDNWKQRALEKQKKLRALEIKVRDLSASRDYWKNRAKMAEEKLRKANLETGAEKKDSHKLPSQIENKDSRGELRVKGHHYSVETIQISVQQVIEGGSSYRGVEKTFDLYQGNLVARYS